MTTPPASPSLNGAAAAGVPAHRTNAPPQPQQPVPPSQGPSSNLIGPAWTRNVVRTTTKAKTPYNGAAGASASSLSLAPSTTTQDAPYLTHVHRHHGQLTLVAPDNLGARRQPGTVDPPSARYDAGGGWGLIDAEEAADYVPPPFIASGGQDEDEEVYYSSKGKKLKSKKGAKKKEKEQKARRERAIMSAVANAGKSPAGPSPLPSPADEVSQIHLSAPTAPSTGTTPRASPGLSSITSSTGSRPSMPPRTGSGTSSSLQQQATSAARRTRRPRPAVPAAGVGGDAGSSSFTSGSSALGDSPHRRPLEGPRPQPISVAASASASSETLRTPPPGVPAFIHAPQPAAGAGPLQQSRAVARARAARNAHAAVKAAGIQARAIQAIQAQAQAQREELPLPPARPSSSPGSRPAGQAMGGESAAMSPSSSANGPGRPATPSATDSVSAQRQQRPRMRHRPSEPLLVPEAIPPRNPEHSASARRPTARSTAEPARSGSRGRSESRSSEHAGGANGPPAALSPSVTSNGPDSLPPPILPPLDLSDPALIEDHLSLGLIDPAMLLMSPPPAYSGRRSLSSTRTARTARPSEGQTGGRTSPGDVRSSTAGSIAGLGLGMERIRTDNDNMSHPSPRYSSVPPSGSPPPPHSRRASPTPSTSTAATTIRHATARHPSARVSPPPPLTSSSSDGSDGDSETGRLSSSESASDEDEDADSFEVTSTDPLVLAWEADRSAGIYTLDERIARDLERRRRAAGEETGDEGTPVEESLDSEFGGDSDREAAADGEPPSRPPVSRPAVPSRVYSSRTEVAANDLAQLRRRISHAEASNNSRGVVRALSVHATRSLRAQGRAARERRGRAAETADSATAAAAVSAARSIRPERLTAHPETLVEDETSRSGQQAASASAASTSDMTGKPHDQALAEGGSIDDPQLARTLSLRGHRMLAEAAERRMRAEKEARLQASSAVRAREALYEEDGDADQPDTATSTAQASSNATADQASPPRPPPRVRQPPPPPPPRSRPPPAERSPAPAFTTSAPSIAWGAAAGTSAQTPLRRPASIRRVPPPPPPNAAEILAAKRASLRPVAVSGLSGATASQPPRPVPPTPLQQQPIVPAPLAASPSPAEPAPTVGLTSGSRNATTSAAAPLLSDEPTQAASQSSASSSVSPPRRRPLPAPPRVLSENRVDAFTALRQSQVLSSQAQLADGEHNAAGPNATSDVRQERADSEGSLYPGPPLPRRPPGRAPPPPPTAEEIVETRDDDVEDSSETGPTTGTSSVRDNTASTGLPPVEIPELSMYTDLDLLLARLESGQDAGSAAPGETAQRNGEQPQGGENYDDLLVLSDVLGQAVPAGATAAELAETLAVARVECERRRVTKDGKVKSKLSVVGVRCVDCAICLARFKVDQFAVVLPDCLHIFHEHCIRSWFRLSRVCPVCRHEVFEPRNVNVATEDASSTAPTTDLLE